MATQAIDVLVQRVARQIRQRRAEHHALRGTFWGTLVAALLLVFKASLGAVAIGGGAAFVAAGALAGALYGALRRIGPVDAARLADRAFALDDRVATALEWAERPDRTPLVDVLVTDTVARVQALPPRRIVRRVLPREVRWLPVPALAVLALALSPAIPLPSSQFPDFLPSGEQEAREERVQSSMLEERSRPQGRQQDGRRVRGHGGARGRPDRSRPRGHAARARQDARAGRGGALGQEPARRARRPRGARARTRPRRRRDGARGPRLRRGRGAPPGPRQERRAQG